MSKAAAVWDHETDVVVVGAGGGLAGALMARDAGLETLVVEKSPWVGGAAAYSGGTLWIFDNPFLRRAGHIDSKAQALRHLDAVVGDAGPAASPARREAYIDGGLDLVDLLTRYGVPLVHSGWADYYADREGGVAAGRTLHAQPFDFRELGEARGHVRPSPLVVAANSVEIAQLALGPRTPKAALTWLRVGARQIGAKLRGADLRTRGQALMGRVYGAALKAGVVVWRETPLQSLIVENGRVVGAEVLREGKTLRIRARRGVLLAAGGFARNRELRAKHQAPAIGDWTLSTPEDTGDAIVAGQKVGAATDLMDEAWWVPGTQPPGSMMLHVWDRCFPHLIFVDAKGERFVNEADPYMEVGQIMLKRQRELGAPGWMIIESRHRDSYAFGMTPPRLTPQAWFDSGYMRKAKTLEELAAQCDFDPQIFRANIERYNAMVRDGVDRDFHRGDSTYNRFYGDAWVKPNPNLGAIEKAPFYAVACVPGDVGTAGGLLADEHARVVTPSGDVIEGLYAAGNCSASVFGRAYPGAGSSIAASMVFSLRATQNMAGKSADVVASQLVASVA
ncbi:fumarate reductase flavoprotein subunit [alpha proteobacterium U9-1i]|nr:fumarate reductase flavoprotein subunit [alpha proteobacterium U9-1i]